MKTVGIPLLGLFALAGCADHDLAVRVTVTDGGQIIVSGSCDASSPPDLKPPAAACAAAQGLTGDTLACIDWNTLTDQTLTNPPPAALPGWLFGKDSNLNDCWEIRGGKLQIKNFPAFVSNCFVKMPALTSTDYAKYSSFTISLLHAIDINKQKQSATIYLNQIFDTQQLWSETGTNPRQTTTIKIDKAALPNGGTSTYQPVFQLSSGQIYGSNGWQIESIAIQGNP
jgi:hypothetical protein